MVEFSDSDLLRNKLVDPAWYTLDIGAVGPWTPSKNGDSNNCLIEATIIRNGDNGDESFRGVPLTLQFNDKVKARGFIEGFLRALGVDVQPGRYNLQAASGLKVDAFVENETYEGRTRNRCNHKYRAVKAAEDVVAAN
jgi:hypothetical protein